ncbi:Protein sprT [Salmonella enterica subsp. enterica]|uniref:Protein sprT n=1 Tax=Salmonella enterica I TaxID=59201 RepID=A0A447N455_SALET|nr:Protein sprT [Salmonella enterica subsp. enterica]
MKTPRLPIAIQQAVMRRLRENLAQANLKLDRHYPEPKLVYTQRGTSAGTAWLESYEIRLNPVLLLENIDTFIAEVVPHETGASVGVEALRTQGSAWQGMEVDDGKRAGRSGQTYSSICAAIRTAQHLSLPLPMPATSTHRPPS